MHIAEGVLTASVLSTGVAGTVAGTGYGLWRLAENQIAKAALLGSAFFVVSLVQVPVGPASTHLVLNGLLGVVLGPVAFPAILIGLLLQALFFGFGGLTTLGINTLNMALPALTVYYLCAPRIRKARKDGVIFGFGFIAGALAIALSSIMVAGSLFLAGRGFTAVAVAFWAVHLPIMLLEGFITGSAVVFLKKVRPEIFEFTIPQRESAIKEPV